VTIHPSPGSQDGRRSTHGALAGRVIVVGVIALGAIALAVGCSNPREHEPDPAALDRAAREVEERVWEFHAADTSRNAEAVIDLMWPEFSMLADGTRMTYDDASSGSRSFMASLDVFHTVWTDLEVTPLGLDTAVSSFQFRDSIVTKAGEVIQNRGPTTLVWERRNDEWRVIFADADHYPISR